MGEAVNVNSEQCQFPVFVIKFSGSGTSGRQNMLECNVGAHTNKNGHSPKYSSSGIKACSVIRAGFPEMNKPSLQKKFYYQPYYTKGSTAIRGALMGGKLVEAAECSTLVPPMGDQTKTAVNGRDKQLPEGQCLRMQDLNSRVGDSSVGQTLSISVQELSETGDAGEMKHAIRNPGTKLFSQLEIDTMAIIVGSFDYDEVLPCSNQGSCNSETGKCTCEDGFTGEACETQVTYV